MALLPKRWTEGYSPIAELQREMNRLFDTFWGGGDVMERAGEWAPAVDLSETENEYVVKAELPGMKAEDVEVSVTGDELAIRGEKKGETEEKKRNYHRVERYSGSFSRVIDLPTSVDSSKVDASFRDGILTVTLPKREEAKAKKVQVKVK